jgi:hypothetical protein
VANPQGHEKLDGFAKRLADRTRRPAPAKAGYILDG